MRTEIDLVHIHVGQLQTGESEPKVAAFQFLRLSEELAQHSLYSVVFANSRKFLHKHVVDVPIVVEFS